MNDDPSIPAADRDEQAAEWCLRLSDVALSPAETAAFDAWIADADNLAAFEEAVAVWEIAGVAAARPETIDHRQRALGGYRRELAHHTRRHPSAWKRGIAVAASLVAAIVIACLHLDPPAERYDTGIGGRQVTLLADGSRLTLDADTKVDVSLSGNRRALKLVSGRARFDVARDPLRPFTVSAGDKIVVATGTSFSVERIGEEVRVALFEGHVAVLQADGPRHLTHSIVPAADGASSYLQPGHELVAAPGAQPGVLSDIDPGRASAWETGRLAFDREPIALAVERVNRYARNPLVVADGGTRDLRISGMFDAGDTTAFVAGLRALYGVDAEKQADGTIRISKRD